MNNIARRLGFSFWSDTRGQDLIEYALMAAFVAVGAAAAIPNFADAIVTVMGRVIAVLDVASSAS